MTGEITINNYHKGILTIQYENFDEFRIGYRDFKRCKLGSYLMLYTSEYKINIGDVFNDSDRNMTIIDREIRSNQRSFYDKSRGEMRSSGSNKKHYKYHCNFDGYEKWIREEHILNGIGCAVCNGRDVFIGLNDIATTAPQLMPYLCDQNDALRYKKKSHQSVLCKCLNCNFEKVLRIADLYIKGFPCPKCGDGFSYPEKFMANLLEQLNEDYHPQLTHKNFEWVSSYRYDFYLQNNNIIIETHGLQHYQECGFSVSYNQQIKIDKNKKKLALNNGIDSTKYIEIDCRKSTSEWIKASVIYSNLNKFYDLSKVNWNNCEKYANSSLVKKACELKRDNSLLTAKEIALLMNIDKTCIVEYLKKGNNLGLCRYDAKDEMRKSAMRNRIKKSVLLLDENGNLIKIFESMSELSRKSDEFCGFKMHLSEISKRCNQRSSFYGNPYKGFPIKFKK